MMTQEQFEQEKPIGKCYRKVGSAVIEYRFVTRTNQTPQYGDYGVLKDVYHTAIYKCFTTPVEPVHSLSLIHIHTNQVWKHYPPNLVYIDGQPPEWEEITPREYNEKLLEVVAKVLAYEENECNPFVYTAEGVIA